MADIQVANTDADLSGNTVLTEENGYTITGLHTFSRSTNAPFACISGAAYVQYLDADKVDGVEAAALLRVDGSLALSANWDAGGYEIRSSTFESDVATGTAPLTIASTTLVANLNADKLDSQEGTYYLAAANFTGTLAVNQGGTGATSLTDGGVLLGSGTGAVTAMAVLADGEMIVGDGSTDPVAESGATLRTSIGVGTGDSPTFTAVTVGQVDITAEGDLRLQDNTGGQYVGLDAPATVSSSYTLTLPAAIGSVNQVLSINNTDGTLQWATPETGDITSVVAGAGMTGGGTTGDVTLNVIGTTDKITVSADAVTIASTYVGQTSITTLGTIATGTWNGTAVANAYVADDLTISGGTVNNSVIGGSTPAAGTFTQVDITAEGDLRLQDNTGGQYVGLDAPATVSGSYTLTLPAAIGAVDQTLTINNTDGTLQWADAGLPTNVDIAGTLDVTGATTLDSTLGVVGAVTFNDAGADVDFRVESDDNANMLFVDGGNDRVGIGTNVPSQPLTVNGVIVAQETFEIATPTVQSNKGVGVYVGGQSNDEVSVAVVSLTDDIAGTSRAWSLVNGRTDSAQTVGTLNFLAATANSQDPLDGAVTVMALDDNGDVDVAGKMTAPQYLSGTSAAISPDATTNLYASSGASGPDGGMIAVRDGYSRFGLFWYGSYDTLTKLAGNSVFSATKDNATTINIYYESGNIVYQNKTAVDPMSITYTRLLF